ncbi:MAG: MMPL family transporter, partial [Methylococcales bacterium]
MTKKKAFFARVFPWCQHKIIHFPWLILILSFAFCGYTAYFTYNHLTINTNTSEMLSPDLPFQKNQKRIDKAFPLEAATVILVVEAETPEETSMAGIKLVELLSKQTDRFDTVYIPTENDFFRQQALLYLEPADLDSLAQKLTDAQPFIGHLAQNYNLEGLFGIISLALNKHDQTLPMDLNPLLLAIDSNINAQLIGQSHRLSWQNLLAENKLNTESNRTIVVAKPKMHFSEMLPAELALTAVRAASKTVMAENPAVRVRITGETALEHEELESVSSGAEISGIASFILVCVIQWIGLRSVKLLIATYIVLAMGLIFTAGFAAITVGHLNVISIAFASLYIGLGVDYAIHICLYYRERKAEGFSNMDAIRYSLKGVGSSLFLCALTTVIGF